MTTTDLNDALNLIKIRIRFFEWRLSMFESDTNSEEVNNCFDSLIEILRELTCISNLDTISNKDKITTTDYLHIVRNIIDMNDEE
jgi:hypothetical protein